MSPPCVGRNCYPNRACSHGTCPMDHRAKKCSCPVPVAAAHRRTRPRTTIGKRTNHLDAAGNDTNGNTQRPDPDASPSPWFTCCCFYFVFSRSCTHTHCRFSPFGLSAVSSSCLRLCGTSVICWWREGNVYLAFLRLQLLVFTPDIPGYSIGA